MLPCCPSSFLHLILSLYLSIKLPCPFRLFLTFSSAFFSPSVATHTFFCSISFSFVLCCFSSASLLVFLCLSSAFFLLSCSPSRVFSVFFHLLFLIFFLPSYNYFVHVCFSTILSLYISFLSFPSSIPFQLSAFVSLSRSFVQYVRLTFVPSVPLSVSGCYFLSFLLLCFHLSVFVVYLQFYIMMLFLDSLLVLLLFLLHLHCNSTLSSFPSPTPPSLF